MDRGAATPTASSPTALRNGDPRIRLIALMILAFGFSSVTQLALLPPMMALTAGVVLYSGVKPSTLLRKLRWPGVIVLGLTILLPLTSGEAVALRIGPLAFYREGLEATTLIATRFICIVSVTVALLATMPALVIIRAMQALGLPWILTDLALLLLRYAEEFRHDLARMRVAMTMRGECTGAVSLSSLRATAWLFGGLMVRSHERSERVYTAMRQRGYGTPAGNSGEPFAGGRADWIALIAVTAMMAMLIGANALW